MLSEIYSYRATMLALALGLLTAGCVKQYDLSERLTGRTFHPMPASSVRYELQTVIDGQDLILHARTEGQCQVTEQRVYERPDIKARRMRQRFVSIVHPELKPCERTSARRKAVALRVGAQVYALGTTDDWGHLRLPLSSGTLALWRSGDPARTTLLVDSVPASGMMVELQP